MFKYHIHIYICIILGLLTYNELRQRQSDKSSRSRRELSNAIVNRDSSSFRCRDIAASFRKVFFKLSLGGSLEGPGDSSASLGGPWAEQRRPRGPLHLPSTALSRIPLVLSLCLVIPPAATSDIDNIQGMGSGQS